MISTSSKRLADGPRFNIGQLAHVIQQNCDISDAQYAGNYSLCIFLLKMREFYRWEKEIPLSQSLTTENVGDWIVAKENAWISLENKVFKPISLNGIEYEPFDTAAINLQLLPHGFVYSAGLGLFNKPHFFLGQLKSVEQKNDVTIYSSGCEYARDLVAPPAMSKDKNIFVRQEPLRRVIWEKIEEWQLKHDVNVPMAKVLACYGIDLNQNIINNEVLERALDSMSSIEANNVVLHELGETEAGTMLGSSWQEMLYQVPRSATQFTLRAVRDHLADCSIALPELIRSGSAASLHFYFANFTGIRKQIFPELFAAYQQWATDDAAKIGDTSNLNDLVRLGRAHWLRVANKLIAAFSQEQGTFDQAVTTIIESTGTHDPI